MKPKLLLLLWICLLSSINIDRAYALPPAEDIPEEVLRTEIILEGRSPINGKSLSASEYEQLQAQLAQRAFEPKINSDIQELIFQLQIRKLIQTIIPFY